MRTRAIRSSSSSASCRPMTTTTHAGTGSPVRPFTTPGGAQGRSTSRSLSRGIKLRSARLASMRRWRRSLLLQTWECGRHRHFWLKPRPPRRHLSSKPDFRSASDCLGQMGTKRFYNRCSAVRVASAVGPLTVEIVRVVGDVGHRYSAIIASDDIPNCTTRGRSSKDLTDASLDARRLAASRICSGRASRRITKRHFVRTPGAPLEGRHRDWRHRLIPFAAGVGPAGTLVFRFRASTRHRHGSFRR
jgi:hypothetical protein